MPGKPGVKPTKALLTITTCNPRWASFERWIVSGVLIDTRPETEGPPPEPRREGLTRCTSALWRHLPGPWPLRVLSCLVLLVAVVAVLFIVVFPWVEPRLPFTDVTVTHSSSSPS